jgi:16S rRNA (guanine966-N2)-methyltransferase
VTRIVAGSLGGRRLAAPAGPRTRPTSDRVREALFSTLQSVTELADARFADLYAGSGAVGLEACSRGANSVLLVESDPAAARTARANIAALGVAAVVRLIVADVMTVVRGRRSATGGSAAPGALPPAASPYHLPAADRSGEPAAGVASYDLASVRSSHDLASPGPSYDLASPDPSYDVVFADPPYALADDQLIALQQALVDGGWLAAGGVLVIERATRSGPVSWVAPLTELRTRRYGETTLWYGRRP